MAPVLARPPATPLTLPLACLPPPLPLALRCRKGHTDAFDFVVVATGLFSIPNRPTWAEGLVSAAPPAGGSGSGPWVVDVKDFTEERLQAAQVRKGRAGSGGGGDGVRPPALLQAGPPARAHGPLLPPVPAPESAPLLSASLPAGQARGDHWRGQVGT